MQFLGLSLYQGLYQDFLDSIKNPSRKTLIFTPNPEILLRASRDQEFLDILRLADYLVPDANGLYTASLMQEGSGFFVACFRTFCAKVSLRKKYGELIQGSNLTRDLVDIALHEKKKILIIDSYRIIDPKNEFEIRKQHIQLHFSDLLTEKLPGIRVRVVCDGEDTPEELAHIIEDEQISYVFSCIGMKRQEQRLIEIWAHLSDDTRVVGLGVGSSFDYILGLQKRAPVLIQRLGLEWFYRLLLSPRARWGRIRDAFWEFPRMVKR